ARRARGEGIMSGDVTDNLPPAEGPRDTNPMLERILEEMRLGFADVRERIGALDARLERGFAELRTDIARSRAVYREELALEAKDLNERMGALERRVNE